MKKIDMFELCTKITFIILIIGHILLLSLIGITLISSEFTNKLEIFLGGLSIFLLVVYGLIIMYSLIGVIWLIYAASKLPFISSRHNPIVGFMIFALIVIFIVPLSMIFGNNSNSIRNSIDIKINDYSYQIYRFNNNIDVYKNRHFDVCSGKNCDESESYNIKFNKNNMKLIYKLFDELFETGTDKYKYDSRKELEYEELDENSKLIIDSIINNNESLLKNYKKANNISYLFFIVFE